MSTFKTAATSQILDPNKRVNYSFGLVLGVADFFQEQEYFLSRHRRHNDALHGYGTAYGLGVAVQPTAEGPEVQVQPGLAVNPRGQTMCVERLMCANLVDWILTNLPALQGQLGFMPPSSLSLLVTLCHAECPTDIVPVPGEPCRTQADARAASRIADSFELRLALNLDPAAGSPPSLPSLPSLPAGASGGLFYGPDESGARAKRAFAELLARFNVTDSASSYATEQDIVDAVRSLIPGSQPASPPSLPGSINIHPGDAGALYRAAFRTWAVEVRPLLPDRPDQECDTPSERCVVLGEVTFDIDAAGLLVPASVAVNDSRRPILVDVQTLEETLLARVGGQAGGPRGAVEAPGPEPVALEAAGRFSIGGGNVAAPVGLVYNGLTANLTSGGAVNRIYDLSWNGYVDPASPGATHMYSVNVIPESTAAQTVFANFRQFGAAAAEIRVRGTNASGFHVNVTRIGGLA